MAGPRSACVFATQTFELYFTITAELFRAAIGFKMCSWAVTVPGGFSTAWENATAELAVSCSSDRFIVLDARYMNKQMHKQIKQEDGGKEKLICWKFNVLSRP